MTIHPELVSKVFKFDTFAGHYIPSPTNQFVIPFLSTSNAGFGNILYLALLKGQKIEPTTVKGLEELGSSLALKTILKEFNKYSLLKIN